MSACPDSKYSAKPLTDMLFFGDQYQGKYTPNAAQFSVYNNTNTTVLFNNIPFSPGGFACFDELRDSCYDQEIPYSFVNPSHTGNFIVAKFVKNPAKVIQPGQPPQAGDSGTNVNRWS